MRKKLLIGLLSGLIATSAFATEWTAFNVSFENKRLLAYERSSVRKVPEGLLVWTAQICDGEPTSDLSLVLLTIDCKQLKFRTEQFTVYNRGERLGEDGPDKRWIYALPDSIGEVQIKTVCARKTSDCVFKGGSWKEFANWGKNIIKSQRTPKVTN